MTMVRCVAHLFSFSFCFPHNVQSSSTACVNFVHGPKKKKQFVEWWICQSGRNRFCLFGSNFQEKLEMVVAWCLVFGKWLDDLGGVLGKWISHWLVTPHRPPRDSVVFLSLRARRSPALMSTWSSYTTCQVKPFLLDGMSYWFGVN